MRRRDRPGVVDLDRRRRAATDKRRPGGAWEPGPWSAWGVLLAIATVWALLRMAGG